MERTLYHGSQIILEKPEYGKGARNNDYGRGFYCTEEIELAREWACAKQTNGYVNQYKLDLEGLRVLNLNNGKYNILNWLALLAANRTYWQNGSIAEEGKRYLKEHFLLDISEYDVIIGYRAGVISLQKLSEAMQLGKLGEQIVLKSPQAFEKIQYVKSELVDMQAYYIKKIERERATRKEYRMSKRQKADLNELFILDIMREEMENDDPRLF